jgi:hypothetical protein
MIKPFTEPASASDVRAGLFLGVLAGGKRTSKENEEGEIPQELCVYSQKTSDQ